ncbi:unnamed protein product [Periconia digitata]|uniref:Uncharacterized protein n=1 Tax=Periconia digitata TaxID=1303443 RepID=A0A9W4UPW4_9PLEO|nr:unnamed protein product [Periconia digitata]
MNQTQSSPAHNARYNPIYLLPRVIRWIHSKVTKRKSKMSTTKEDINILTNNISTNMSISKESEATASPVAIPEEVAAAHKERMAQLKKKLEDINESVEIRDMLLALSEKHSEYAFNSVRSMVWRRDAARDKRVFENLKRKMEIAGEDISKQMARVKDWERIASDLHQNTLNQSETIDIEHEDLGMKPGVFTEGWGWDQPEGSGPGIEEPVDPKDVENKNPDIVDDGVDYSKNFNKRNTGAFR